jgi:amino acid transporter
MLFLCFGIKRIEPGVFISSGIGADTNWDALFTWVLWLYSGVLNMSSVAREVKNPEKSYLFACGVLLLMDIVFINFTPLWVSLSLDPDRTNYSSGHFATLARDIAGEWLFLMLTVGAQVCIFHVCNLVYF